MNYGVFFMMLGNFVQRYRERIRPSMAIDICRIELIKILFNGSPRLVNLTQLAL